MTDDPLECAQRKNAPGEVTVQVFCLGDWDVFSLTDTRDFPLSLLGPAASWAVASGPPHPHLPAVV